MPNATTSYSGWDFHNFHVQQELKGGEFINAETTLVASGPPELSDVSNKTGDFAFPIGVLENVGLSQSKQLQRIFEIGSSRSYFIPGRVVGSLSIGRVVYYGPSLLKSLYSYIDWAGGDTFEDGQLSTGNLVENPTNLDSKLAVAPGFGDLMLNLGSDLFNLPCGLALYFRNQVQTNTAAIYLENAHVQGHQLSISSGSVLLMEGASLQYDRLVPINLSNQSTVNV